VKLWGGLMKKLGGGRSEKRESYVPEQKGEKETKKGGGKERPKRSVLGGEVDTNTTEGGD